MSIVSVIASHNTRLQCLIDFIRDETTPKIRYMNCVIFKLVITNDQLDLSMIYSGELEEHEQRKISVDRPYYVKDLRDCYPRGQSVTPNVENVEWIGPKPYNVYTPYTSTNFKTRLKLPPVISNTHIFYLVRHGQGLHNATNTYGMTLDTPLTRLGYQQAERAGDALKQHIDRHHPQIPPQQYYFFVSDLLRTQQTCETISFRLFRANQYSDKFIVLPCAHEITTKGNNKGNCDQVASESNLYKKVARENYPSCTTNQGRLNPTCNEEDNEWSYYLDFYGNKIRAEQNYTSNYVRSFFQPQRETKQCRNTNMISEAMQIIQERLKRRRRGGQSKKRRNNKRITKKLK